MNTEFIHSGCYRRNKKSALKEGKAIRESARLHSKRKRLLTNKQLKDKLTKKLILERQARDDNRIHRD